METEDDSNFIMENDEEDGDRTARIEDLVDEEDRGALVQKIMETKAEIEDGGGQDQVEESDADKIMTVEREKMKQLQEKLQDLTRSAYPLARLFDFANVSLMNFRQFEKLGNARNFPGSYEFIQTTEDARAFK